MTPPRGRDLVELAVLGLLRDGPRHPYAMQRLLERRGSAVARGLPRSLYHAVDGLVERGLVAAGETEREGRRPERTLFAVTAAGRAALADRVRALLAEPGDPPAFRAALGLMADLDPGDVLHALEARLAAIEAEVARLAAELVERPAPSLIELDYRRSQLAAEAGWVRALVADLRGGRLPWIPPGADMAGSPRST